MNKIFIQRRRSLMNQLTSGVVIVPTTREILRSQDSTFKFRYDSYFYYLTNFTEPDAILLLDISNNKQIIFCREKNPERETWDGFRYGLDAVKSIFGFDESYNIEDFPKLISSYLYNLGTLYYSISYMPWLDSYVLAAIDKIRKTKGDEFVPQNIIDINYILADKRLIKDDYDIANMKKVGEISSLGHIAAMKAIKTAKTEAELEGVITYEFLKHGATGHSYTPIVGCGKNSCTLHYNDNNQPLVPGELVLIDAGAEYLGYAGDVTRTIPVSGAFTQAQRDIYNIVLEANKQAIDLVKAENTPNQSKEKSIEVVTQGLVNLGILHGDVPELIESGAYRRFYMHGVGHWLGLDVHDVGLHHDTVGNCLPFRVGMITTIEPGIYITEASDIPSQYWNIGVRIEDDILITTTGNYNLTGMVAKEIAEIERLINS